MEDDRAENQQDKAELEEEEMLRVPAEPASNIKDAEREKGVIGAKTAQLPTPPGKMETRKRDTDPSRQHPSCPGHPPVRGKPSCTWRASRRSIT